MRDQLINYVRLLFAGSPDSYDMQQEILQNTLDRYDDLISQGKSPEAAYRLAIAGIGDIGEILSSAPTQTTSHVTMNTAQPTTGTPVWKIILRAAAIFLYIISVIPLFVLSEMGMETIGLCGTIAIAAVATVLIILSSVKKSTPVPSTKEETQAPQKTIRGSILSALGTVSVCIYLIISFATGAWHLTWLVFPILAAVRGLVNAIFDLKEAKKYET